MSTDIASCYAGNLPDDMNQRFLRQLRIHGNVYQACLSLGVTRQTMYSRRRADPEFAREWLIAMDEFQEDFRQIVIATAMKMGAGRVVPVLDDDFEPVLDEEGNQVFEIDTKGVDPKIVSKLLDKAMKSADGPPQTLVQVNNSLPYNPNRLPELVLEDVQELEAPNEALQLPKLSGASAELCEPNKSNPDDAWLFE